MAIRIMNHSLIRHKVGVLREKNISTKYFHALASVIARLRTYQATKDLKFAS